MRPPDVALVVPSLAGGGAERTAVTILRDLVDRGFAADLVCFEADGPYLADVPPSAGLVDLGVRRARHALPGLVRYLRRRRPPVLLTFLDRTTVLAVLAVGLARVDARVVGRVGNTMSLAAAGSSRWQDRLRPALARAFYGRCAAVVAISDGVARDLVERVGLPESLLHVIHNPRDVEDVASRAEAVPAHPWLSCGDRPVILGIGRLTRQKDFPTLIRAFARVRRRVEGRLVILGEGEDRDALLRVASEEGVGDDVDLPGFVHDPAPYLRRAGVFALSSAWEGFGIVVVEALAVGTPVVAADCESGPREILEGGRHGRLVPVGDPDAMADAILAALSEEPDREALRARARDFAPEVIVPEYLRVLGLEP